jgi:hypothetical protein
MTKKCRHRYGLFKGKFIVLNANIGKEERSKISHLSFHLKKLEHEQLKSKGRKTEKIIKLRQK